MQLQVIESKIFEVRGLKVMLDFSLAEMYETETKYLKRESASLNQISAFSNIFLLIFKLLSQFKSLQFKD